MKKIVILLISLLCILSLGLMACSNKISKTPTVDDHEFIGSTNSENLPLETDDFIKIDGQLDEKCWENKNWYSYSYEGVTVNATTTFSELGFYIGFKILDSHVYGVENRMVWMGSSIEIYVDRGDSIKRTNQTFQYRLSALNEVEILNGIKTPEDNWSWKYLPIYGLTKTDGIINSATTKGINAEIFVRWDALGYDYKAVDFVAPDAIKMMAVYNQSSGAEISSPRSYWVNNGGNINNPIEYWQFNTDGYVNFDLENAIIGDGLFGRGKTPGWNLNNLSSGKVTSSLSGEQSIYFKNIYAQDYAVTTLVSFKEALKFWKNLDYSSDDMYMLDPYPKAGLILGGDKTLQAFLMDYNPSALTSQSAQGMFFNKGNPDSRDLWTLSEPYSADNLTNLSKAVRLTGVKQGKFYLIFIGDENTAKYAGTFIGMIEDPVLSSKASPGLFTMGCAVDFTDYEATENKEIINNIIKDILSTLVIENKTGGSIDVKTTGYKMGETAKVSIKTIPNYKLTSLKVNGEEKIGNIEKGKLSIVMDNSTMTITPSYQKINENKFDVNAKIVVGSGYLDFKHIEILTTDGNGIYNRYQLNADGTLNIALPNGSYTAYIYLNNIYKKEFIFTMNSAAINVGDIVVDGNIEFTENENVIYNEEGSISITGENVNKNIANFTATDKYFIETSLERNDGNFNVTGYWTTGGVVVTINEKNYRLFFMRENSDSVILYLNKQEAWDKTIEFRMNYRYSGTGAPIKFALVFNGQEINILINGEKHFNINLEMCNNAYDDLFSSSTQKEIGFMVVDKVDGGIKFSNFSYSNNSSEVSKKLDSMCHFVSAPTDLIGGVVSVSSKKLFMGESLIVNVKAEDNYILKSFLINGENKLDALVDGQLTINNIHSDIDIQATFERILSYSVSGAFSYAKGLYIDGDTVTVSSGSYQGIVDFANKTYNILLPKGTHTIVLSSTRYKNITIDAVINGETALSDLVFKYVKMVENANVVYNEYGSVGIKDGFWQNAEFAGIKASGGFEVNLSYANTDRNSWTGDGGWSVGTIIVKADKVYHIHLMKEGDGLVVYLNDGSANAEYRQGGSILATGGASSIDFAFINSEATIIIDKTIKYTLKKDNAKNNVGTIVSVSPALNGFFDFVGDRYYGIGNIGALATFWNIRYMPITTLDAKYNLPQSTIFTDNINTTILDGNKTVIARNQAKILQESQGNSLKVNNDFKITFTSERADGYFKQEGSWDNGGLYISANGVNYKIFLMRASSSSTFIYIVSDNGAVVELKGITNELMGTGAPTTISLYYQKSTQSWRFVWGNVYAEITSSLVNNSALSSLFDSSAQKEIGFYSHAATAFSNIVYSTDATAVAQEIQNLGKPTIILTK